MALNKKNLRRNLPEIITGHWFEEMLGACEDGSQYFDRLFPKGLVVKTISYPQIEKINRHKISWLANRLLSETAKDRYHNMICKYRMDNPKWTEKSLSKQVTYVFCKLIGV